MGEIIGRGDFWVEFGEIVKYGEWEGKIIREGSNKRIFNKEKS